MYKCWCSVALLRLINLLIHLYRRDALALLGVLAGVGCPYGDGAFGFGASLAP